MLKFVIKLWGSEEWLVNNEKYCAKFLNLVNGYQCSLHYHKLKDETFYILEGIVELEIEDKQDGMFVGKILHRGDSIRLKPNDVHRFKAITEHARILEVSTTHIEEDSYRLEESRNIR